LSIVSVLTLQGRIDDLFGADSRRFEAILMPGRGLRVLSAANNAPPAGPQTAPAARGERS
jgi:hypothetical protein